MLPPLTPPTRENKMEKIILVCRALVTQIYLPLRRTLVLQNVTQQLPEPRFCPD